MNSPNSNSFPWHTLRGEEALKRAQSQKTGLSEKEAQRRLSHYGPNELPRKPRPGALLIFFRQFQSPLIYILAIAAVVSLTIGEKVDAGFIAAVLLINAIVGFIQEWRAEKSNEALERLLKIKASVLRDGIPKEIDAEELVPGDIVWLESGVRVPGDIRLLSGHGLEIDESALTGESVPVVKNPQWLGQAEDSTEDLINMAHAGTTVARGRGEGVVVETGSKTIIGQLAMDILSGTAGKAPLMVRLEKFTRVVGLAVVFAAFVVALVGLARQYGVMEMFFFAVALAVSAIPEGLPVAVTVALAIGTNRMAKRGVIIRKLAAVEGLGSCTLIASDKTGTLTCNELTVREIFLGSGKIMNVTGEGFEPRGNILREGSPVQEHEDPELDNLLLTAVLCNEADLRMHDNEWIWRGDPTEVSLLTLGLKGGWSAAQALEEYPEVNQIPFEAENQFAASYNRQNASVKVFVKGAPERILEMCHFDHPIKDPKHYQEIAHHMAERGFRVLGFAYGDAPPELSEGESPPMPRDLKFQGFVGMIDPLRPKVKEAVETCKKAGVAACMVTGDHPVTALAIARELGLAHTPEQVLTGQDVKNSSEGELKELVKKTKVFARVAPHEKFRIVNALRANRHFVAVTGDGVNDAPALQSANIGVAMGKAGTDVARDAADIVISDDDFSTIVGGVEEGRIAYNNVRNVIYLLISTGAAEVILVTLALAFGLPLPLLPAQLLWLNLVTNGIQDVALAFEPGLGDELEKPPRPPQERIFNRLMVERVLVGAVVMGGVGFGAFYHMLETGWSQESARNAILLLFVLFENFHLGNSRSETRSAFALSPFRGPFLLWGAITATSIHILFMYLPLGQKLLHTQPMPWQDWKTIIAMAFLIIICMEIHKLTWYLRHRQV